MAYALFLYKERGSVTQRVTFLLAVLSLAAALLLGCGGQDTMPVEEKEATDSEAPVEEGEADSKVP